MSLCPDDPEADDVNDERKADSPRRAPADQFAGELNEEALERQVRQMKAALIVKLDKKTGKKTPNYIVRVAEGKAS